MCTHVQSVCLTRRLPLRLFPHQATPDQLLYMQHMMDPAGEMGTSMDEVMHAIRCGALHHRAAHGVA